MPSSYFTMWGLLILLALGAGLELWQQGNPLEMIRAAYPSDDAQREALHRCGEMDADFSRFSSQDREHCYRTVLRVSSDFGENK